MESRIDQIDNVLDKILHASGSAWKNYTLAKSCKGMRDALSEVYSGWELPENKPKEFERVLLCLDCGPGSIKSIHIGFYSTKDGYISSMLKPMVPVEEQGYRAIAWLKMPPLPPAGSP